MRTVSHYELIEKLGEGGMGVVWKGRDTRLDRFVAIKFLPIERTADPERKRRFAQEARAASALNHPRIITIYDIDHADGADFIVMEFVAGKTLEQMIPSKGMKPGDAVNYAMQIADALAAAHAAGIVHRDLKPANVMVSDAGQVKVLDFGLAKLEEGPVSGETERTRTILEEAKTGDGVIVGTTSYMSPEQAEGKKLDARSDIFSFGSVLYEMLTGKRAFRGDSTMSTLAAILRAEPEPLEKLVEGAPRELVRIVQRCLRKNPEDRAQSMADLRIALKDFKEESESGRLAAAPASPRRSRMRLWIAAAIGVLAAAAFAAYVISTGRNSPDASLQAVVLTSYPGLESSPSFSPDGNQVVFAWNGEGQDNYDIYVKLLGPGKPLRLTADRAIDASPVWSPDGRWIAFLRNNSLMVVPPIGGAEREVAQGPFGTPGTPASGLSRAFRVISWSPDSRWLVVSGWNAAPGPFGLLLVSIETGEKRSLTTPPGTVSGDYFGEISPDGKTLAFARFTVLGNTVSSESNIYLLPLGSDYTPRGEPTRLTSDNLPTAGLAWTADSREIVFSSPKNGPPSLWRMAVSGSQKPVKLAVGENGIFPAISRSGQRLAFNHAVPIDLNIWRIDLTDPALGPASLIASTRLDQSPQYSPDGQRIVFSSERSGPSEVWVSDADGGNATQVTTIGASGSPAWSPDGKRIAFDHVIESRWQIFVVNARGGKAEPLTSGPEPHIRPSWSHDGQWVYCSAGRGIQKIPVSGGPPVQLVSDGGDNAVESADGRSVYYQRIDGIRRVGTDGSGERKLMDGATTPNGLGPTAYGLYYFFPRAGGRSRSLQFFTFSSGQSRVIREMGKQGSIGLSVSPDGKWLLYTQRDTEATGDLMLVDPFR